MPVQCAPPHSNVLRAPLNAYDRQILGPHPPLENLIQVVCTFNTSPGNSDWDPKNIFWEIQWHSGRQQNLLQASLRWLQFHERTKKGETELVWEIEGRLPGRGAFKEEVKTRQWEAQRHCHLLPHTPKGEGKTLATSLPSRTFRATGEDRRPWDKGYTPLGEAKWMMLFSGVPSPTQSPSSRPTCWQSTLPKVLHSSDLRWGMTLSAL